MLQLKPTLSKLVMVNSNVSLSLLHACMFTSVEETMAP